MSEGGRATVRVLLVDDSPLVLAILTRILDADPGIEVVGTAPNGLAALSKAVELRPDVVCTDLHMPVMGGLELTRRLMAEQPVPILVISVSVHPHDSENIFRLLEAGAVDVFPKPDGGFRVDSPEAEALRRRVRMVAGVKVFQRRTGTGARPAPRSTTRPTTVPTPSPPRASAADASGRHSRLVAIGGSTGGPKGLATILGSLPSDYPLPILCVQHISAGFTESLVSWLDEVAAVRVTFAVEGDRPQPGHAYFAPEGRHLALGPDGCLRCPVEGDASHLPSVNVLFASLAARHGPETVAVLLSGMGTDGAEGMVTLARAGALTIAQDEETSVVFGMPGEAIRLGAVQHVLPIEAIGPFLAEIGVREGVKRSGGWQG